MRISLEKSCYACTKEAVNKEHVPPLAFFPPGFRTMLETVPSCEEHNNDNSKDVEYVRNLVTTCAGINDVGQLQFNEKSRRSFERSPALFRRTFRQMQPIPTPLGETGGVPFDMDRFNSVMKGIATALYFRDYGQRHMREWGIFSPSLLHSPSLCSGQPDPWLPFRQLVSATRFEPQPTNHPWVFRYAVFDPAEGPAYRLEFYEGFRVVALSIPSVSGGKGMPTDATQRGYL